MNQTKVNISEVLERITDAFVALDKNWCCTYMNKKAGEILNRDPEKIIGKNIWEEFPEGIGQPFYKAYEKAMAEQKYIYLEEYYSLYGKWFESHIYPSPDGLSIYFRDISEQKEVEEAIKESEEKYRTLMQQAGDYILLFSGTGKLLEANLSARQLLGYSMEEYEKKSLKDLFFKEDLKQNPFQFDLLNKGKSTINERRLKRKNGTALETEIHTRKLSDGNYLAVARDLTERIKAEKQIRESEEKYRILVEHASDGIVITTTNGIYIDINSTICNMLGYTKEELRNKNLIDLLIIRKGDVPLRIDEVLAGKTVLQERCIIKKNGDILTVELNSKLLPDNRILVIVRDITERSQIEGALRQSNERNDIVAKATSDVVWDWDIVSGKVYRSKKGLKKVYGYDDNSPIKMVTDWNMQVHPDDREMMKKLIEEIHQSHDQTTFSAEYRFLRQDDGKYVNVFDRGYIVRDEQGKPVRMIGAAQNITERKKADDLIKKQKEQYDELVRNIPVGVYKFRMKPDGSMSFDYISPRLCEMIGVKEEDAYRDIMNAFKVVHPDDFGIFMKSIEESFVTKQDFSWEGRAIIDNQLKWMKIELAPKVLENGDTLWDGVVADITDRKTVEEKISKLNSELEQRVKERTVELETANADLEEVNDLFLGREARIIELKEELEESKNKFKNKGS